MFTARDRDRCKERLLARAEADDAITGAAFTGSLATGDGDRWSDTDLVLAVRGQPRHLEPFSPPDPEQLAGLVWHHALHARICIERGRRWQAEHWISAIRDHVITLACVRLGYPASYAKGAHLLPDDLTAPLEATLVRSLGEPELRRALAAAITVGSAELDRNDPALADRLRPMLTELCVALD
jgi:hypothetical protein